MTFFFDGDALYAIRYTMALGDTTIDSLLSVTALSDEIPDDMLFDVPEGYTEYSFSDDDTSVNENAEFPSELPEFTAGTLMMAEEVGGEYTFAYADTTQADCDAYIAALTADGFTDVGLEDVFTATKDGWDIAVYFSEGVTADLLRAPHLSTPPFPHSAQADPHGSAFLLFCQTASYVECNFSVKIKACNFCKVWV